MAVLQNKDVIFFYLCFLQCSFSFDVCGMDETP